MLGARLRTFFRHLHTLFAGSDSLSVPSPRTSPWRIGAHFVRLCAIAAMARFFLFALMRRRALLSSGEQADGREDAVQTITTHYIDGAFVPSHGARSRTLSGQPTVKLLRVPRWPTRRIRGALSPPRSAPLPLTAHLNRSSARKFCAGCTGPLRLESTN